MNKVLKNIFLNLEKKEDYFLLPNTSILSLYFSKHYNLKVSSTESKDLLKFISDESLVYKVKNQKILEFIIYAIAEQKIEKYTNYLYKLLTHKKISNNLFAQVARALVFVDTKNFYSYMFEFLPKMQDVFKIKILLSIFDFFKFNNKIQDFFINYLSVDEYFDVPLKIILKKISFVDLDLFVRLSQDENSSNLLKNISIFILGQSKKMDYKFFYNIILNNIELKHSAIYAMSILNIRESLDYVLKNYNNIDKDLVIECLRSFSVKFEDYLIGLLKKSYSDVVLLALGYMKSSKVKPFLITYFDEGDVFVFESTIFVVGLLEDNSYVPYLLKLLDSDNQFLFDVTVETLGRIKDSRAVAKLIKLFTPSNKELSNNVALALGKIGDSLSIDAIVDAYRRKYIDEHVLIKAISMFDGMGSAEFLVEYFFDEDSVVRIAAVKSAKKIYKYLSEDIFIKLMFDKHFEVRKEAAYILGEIKSIKAVDILIEHLKDYNSDVVVESVNALVKIGEKRAVNAIIQDLDFGNEKAVLAKIEAIEIFGDKNAMFALAKLAANPSPKIAEAIEHVLELI